MVVVQKLRAPTLEGTLSYLRLLIVGAVIGVIACGSGSEALPTLAPATFTPIPATASPAIDDAVTAGSLAGAAFDAFSCEGVLQRPGLGVALNTRPVTGAVQAETTGLASACTASYSAANGNGPSLTVGLFNFTSAITAAAHMGIVNRDMAASGISVSPSSEGDRTELFIFADLGGIGQMIIIKFGTVVASVHNGPTATEAAVWPSDVLRATAIDLAQRLNAQ
jgi:hypothetical protein